MTPLRVLRTIAYAGCLSLAIASAAAPQSRSVPSVEITEPKDGARVCLQQLVRGKVSDGKLQVFVLVRPLVMDRAWVQPVPARDSQWHTAAFFGEQDKGIGEPFEILAIAATDANLMSRGKTVVMPLAPEPSIVARSKAVVVTRDRCQ